MDDVALKGRQVIKMIYDYLKLDTSMQKIYDITDLTNIKWFGDDGAESFMRVWEFVKDNLHPDSGVNNMTLRNVLYRKIPLTSQAFGSDMKEYRRYKDTKPEEYNHTWLEQMIYRHIRLMRQDKVEQQREVEMMTFQQGGKKAAYLEEYMDAAPGTGERKGGKKGGKDKGKGKGKGKKGDKNKSGNANVGGAGGDRPKGGKDRTKGRPPSATDDKKRYCYDFNFGTCAHGAECWFKHENAPAEIKAKMICNRQYWVTI